MSMTNGMFKTRALDPANLTNERGKRTWEWKQEDGRQTTLCVRLEGESFGNHFHKGDDPDKNPEIFLVLEGKIWIKFTDQNGLEEILTLDVTEKPIELTIMPFVFHELKALTTCKYIETRLHYFDPAHPDTYPIEEFYKLFPAAISKG